MKLKRNFNIFFITRHEQEKRDLGQLGHIVENIDNMASKIEDMSSSLSKFEIKLRKKKWRKGKVPGNREEGRSMKEDEDNETKFRQQGLEGGDKIYLFCFDNNCKLENLCLMQVLLSSVKQWFPQ